MPDTSRSSQATNMAIKPIIINNIAATFRIILFFLFISRLVNGFDVLDMNIFQDKRAWKYAFKKIRGGEKKQ
jgi:hypothetical protein